MLCLQGMLLPCSNTYQRVTHFAGKLRTVVLCIVFHVAVCIVPAYRGFNLSGVNLAEAGHSTMRVWYKMLLAVAAWKDMCHQIIQDRDYIAFVENTDKVTGKGLNLMQTIARKKKTDKIFVTSALDALQTGDLEAEAMIHLDDEIGFIPSNSARHRVPEIYPSSNPMQKHRHNNNRSQVQKKKKKKTNVDEISNDCEEDEENGNAQNMSLVPCDKEKEHLITNPPQLVFLMSMIEICQGCRRRYTAKDRKKPNDFVFKYLMYCDQYGTKERNHYRSPGYFHAYDLGCMRRYDELENVKMDEIYLSNTTFHTLTCDHIKKLKKNNMWDAIIRNRQRLM